MCNMVAVKSAGTSSTDWTLAVAAFNARDWVEKVCITEVFGLSQVQNFSDVRDGTLSAVLEVIEGECGYAIAAANTLDGYGPFRQLTRFRISGIRPFDFRAIVPIFLPRGKRAFFSIIASKDSDHEKEMFAQLNRIIPNLMQADRHVSENGGSMFKRIVERYEEQWFLKAYVPTKPEGLRIFEAIKQIEGVHVAVAFIEADK